MAENNPRAFVIGWPISHSLSPQLHGFWLKQYGVKGEYEKIAIAEDQLDAFLDTIRKDNFVGGNVTIPHKQTAYARISNTSPTAKILQAVNTIWLDNGELVATNTDGYGFTANLDDFCPEWRAAKSAVVLGAGGAARAIVLALLDAGLKKIVIANRTIAKAKSLAQKMGSQCSSADMADIDLIDNCLSQTDMLINTTSLGMKGQPSLEINIGMLPKSAIVSDIVYNPLNTELLQRARSLNLKTVDGIGMLLHQAVPGFEKWFGPRPRVSQDLRQYMLKLLGQDKS